MFEIGDVVFVVPMGTVGKIVNWYFDEGNVWTVRMPGGQHWEFCECELKEREKDGKGY